MGAGVLCVIAALIVLPIARTRRMMVTDGASA
jgi:hypothetical protein